MAHLFSRKPVSAMVIALLLMILTTSLVSAATGDISTFAGDGTPATTGDSGASTSAQVNRPGGVGIDGSGNVYIAEVDGNVIRKVNASGNISTFAGTGTGGFSGDSGLATAAQLNGPQDVMADSSGNVYIADSANHRVRKIDTSGNISTVAGTGVAGSSGDSGLAINAQLNNPQGLAMDTAGNIYIADRNNHRIRKIDTSGNISTVAGTGTIGFSGDSGLAINAQLRTPSGLKVNNANEIFIADYGNHRVRKVDASGFISTVAGNGTLGLSGDGGPAVSAQLFDPSDIELYQGGGFYIADTYNHRIRLVNSSGDISTVAGTTVGFSGDGGPAVSAQLSYPTGIAQGVNGTLYIADVANNRVRAVEGPPPPEADLQIVKSASPASVDAGASLTYTLTVINNGPDTANNVTVTDTLPGAMTADALSSGCSGSTTVTCTVASLANGATQVFTIYVTAPSSAGTITNSASVSANNPADSTSANDSSSLDTTVNAVADADLAIVKTASVAIPLVSQNFTYTLTVTNNGPDTATGVTITDTLPTGVTLVSAPGCSGTTTITCAASSIANAGVAAFDITVKAPGTFGTISNTASVSASSPGDSVSGNNSDTLDLEVGSPAGVPGLTTWGMGALALMLGASAYVMRRRRAAALA